MHPLKLLWVVLLAFLAFVIALAAIHVLLPLIYLLFKAAVVIVTAGFIFVLLYVLFRCERL